MAARKKTLDQVARTDAVFDVYAWNTPGLPENAVRIVATFLRPDDACAFANALPDKCGEDAKVVMRGGEGMEMMNTREKKQVA